jgi:hypothetical protein
MPFVPVPNTIEVDINYLQDSQVLQNTLYFENPIGWDAGEIGGFLTALRTLIVSDLMPLLSASIQVFELVGKLLDAASSVGFTLAVSPPVSGGDINEAMPNHVSYAISFKTGLSGRSFRGRNYVPGLTTASVEGNVISSATRTGLLDFYTTVLDMATTASVIMVVVSRYSGIDPVTKKPIPRVTGITTPILSFSTADLVIDSQRRRLPGRGS